MRLSELEPKWLWQDGRCMGFIFKSPLKRQFYQTCFFLKVPRRVQWDIVKTNIGDLEGMVQFCNPACGWKCTPMKGVTFENISITPSLDGSRGGLWHGYITNGEIVGGM